MKKVLVNLNILSANSSGIEFRNSLDPSRSVWLLCDEDNKFIIEFKSVSKYYGHFEEQITTASPQSIKNYTAKIMALDTLVTFLETNELEYMRVVEEERIVLSISKNAADAILYAYGDDERDAIMSQDEVILTPVD